MKKIVYNLPTVIKLNSCKVISFFDMKKRKAIKMLDSFCSSDFEEINSMSYKKNLKKYFNACFIKAEGIKEYLNSLYNDRIELFFEGEEKAGSPYVICVVKNEEKKLRNFFEHYKKIGTFNFIFIDNGSTDLTREIIVENGGTVYRCFGSFTTRRKLAWINRIYASLPNGVWTILLDADELLVYNGYEEIKLNKILTAFDEGKIMTAGAVMVDMFAIEQKKEEDYLSEYVYFENNFHVEKSFFCNSVYGGIREREFKFGKDRMFLIKKHPIIKKTEDTMLIHCHYIYPFSRNYSSEIFFGLLHYKLFDSEIEKYKKIAEEGIYGNQSIEYKTYIKTFASKTYDEIFRLSDRSERYMGTVSLENIECIKDVRKIL